MAWDLVIRGADAVHEVLPSGRLRSASQASTLASSPCLCTAVQTWRFACSGVWPAPHQAVRLDPALHMGERRDSFCGARPDGKERTAHG